MSEESIKFTIGASKAASIDRVFADIRKQAARIGQDLNRFLNPKSAIQGLDAYKAKLAEVAQQTKGLDRVRLSGVRQVRSEEDQLMRDRLRNEARVAKERERALRYVAGVRSRMFAQEQQKEERAFREAERRQQRFGRMVSHRATRFLAPEMPVLSLARRGANAIANGIGVDLSGASAIRSAVEHESAAVKVSNAGYIEGDSRNGKRVDPKTLISEGLSYGAKYGFDPSQVTQAVGEFGKRTGDLQTARDMLEQLTRLAAATGTDLQELYGTAGALNNQLQDIPAADRAKAIPELIATLAQQGKLGAVELEDAAKYGDRMFSTAGLYEGDKIANIKKLGAFTQAAKSFGGADSPAMAATATARLATTFKTSARAKAFEDITGKSVFGGGGKIRDPLQLIKEAVVATKGKPLDWNKIFANVMAERTAAGVASKFRGAYDNTSGTEAQRVEAGEKAIDDFMKSMTDAALSEKQIADSIDKIKSTLAYQANDMNVRFQKAATTFLERLTPLMEDLAPKLESFAKTLGDVTTWVIENPKAAIAAAIGISIARAGIESALRIGIEKAFSGGSSIVEAGLKRMLAGGAPPVVPPVAPAGAAAATVGAAAAFGGAAIGVGALGYAAYGPLQRLTQENAAERAGNVAASQNAGNGSLQAKLASLEAGGRVIDQDLAGARSRASFGGLAGPAPDQVGRMAELISEQRKNNAEMAQVKALLAGGITVTLSGQPPGRASQDGNRNNL